MADDARRSARKKPTMRQMRAYADIGSHGGIYEFFSGPVADQYPGLLHIYLRPLKGLMPVTITYRRPR